MAMDRDHNEDYQAPKLDEWGTVADLTETGLTNPGEDGKAGSRPSEGV
jgi:hypothetical protein